MKDAVNQIKIGDPNTNIETSTLALVKAIHLTDGALISSDENEEIVLIAGRLILLKQIFVLIVSQTTR